MDAQAQKRADDLEAYMTSRELAKMPATLVAHDLSKSGIRIHPTNIKSVRTGQKLNNRTLWKLWASTGKTIDSLKPTNTNALQEYMFELDLTDHQLADTVGIPRTSVYGIVYRGVQPQPEVRAKLFEATKLADFAPVAPQPHWPRATPSKPLPTRVDEPPSVADLPAPPPQKEADTSRQFASEEHTNILLTELIAELRTSRQPANLADLLTRCGNWLVEGGQLLIGLAEYTRLTQSNQTPSTESEA